MDTGSNEKISNEYFYVAKRWNRGENQYWWDMDTLHSLIEETKKIVRKKDADKNMAHFYHDHLVVGIYRIKIQAIEKTWRPD